MKISEWLAANVDSHSVYKDEEVKSSFEEQTGRKACWPSHSNSVVRNEVGNAGYVLPGTSCVAYGYEIAEALARKYATQFPMPCLMGKGFKFQAAVVCLTRAGE